MKVLKNLLYILCIETLTFLFISSITGLRKELFIFFFFLVETVSCNRKSETYFLK